MWAAAESTNGMIRGNGYKVPSLNKKGEYSLKHLLRPTPSIVFIQGLIKKTSKLKTPPTI